jgi:hypothetical protein
MLVIDMGSRRENRPGHAKDHGVHYWNRHKKLHFKWQILGNQPFKRVIGLVNPNYK